MPKRVQDIIPGKKRSIRDISIHGEKETIHHSKLSEKEIHIKVHKPAHDKVVGSLISYGHNDSKSTKRKRKVSLQKFLLIFFGSVILISIVGYFASQYYAVAKFNIIPASFKVVVSDKTILALASSSPDNVQYFITKYADTKSIEVKSTDGPYSETKSTGKVTIYNNYSKTSQRLIAGTRLVLPSGLIFKLTNSITVPGMSTKSAGQISVSIIADKAGQEYNIKSPNSDVFHILGFKGTPKYEGFYAKLSTDTINGFAGVVKNISKADIASSTKYLEQELFADLSKKVMSGIPTDSIIFDNSIIFSTSSIKIATKDNDTSLISMDGQMSGISFDKYSLFEKLAGNLIIDKFKKYSFDTLDLQNLHMAITNMKDFSLTKKNTLVSNFTGSVTIVSRIPIDEIKSKILGLPLSKTVDIMHSYSSIIDPKSSGQVVPNWSNIPTRVDNIDITVEKIE